MLSGWEGDREAWKKITAAYHQVHDYVTCSLQADCLETGISSRPYARLKFGTTLPLQKWI